MNVCKYVGNKVLKELCCICEQSSKREAPGIKNENAVVNGNSVNKPRFYGVSLETFNWLCQCTGTTNVFYGMVPVGRARIHIMRTPIHDIMGAANFFQIVCDLASAFFVIVQ